MSPSTRSHPFQTAMAAPLHYLPTAMEYPDIKPLRRVLPPPKVFLQDTCAKHQFVRSRDLTGVYERPERLKAAYLGVAAAYSRLETAFLRTTTPAQPPFEILTSAASVKFDQLAVTYVHGQEEGSYLANLSRWAAESKERIAKGQLEIPDSLKDLEDDLYRECGNVRYRLKLTTLQCVLNLLRPFKEDSALSARLSTQWQPRMNIPAAEHLWSSDLQDITAAR